MIISALIILFIVLIRPSEHKVNLQSLEKLSVAFKWRTIQLTLIGAVLIACNWLTYIYVINSISINAGAFAYLILPIATAFLSFFILKEKLSKLKWFGITLGLVSCILIANVKPEQLFYVLVVTLTYSFYMISQRANTHFNRRLLLAIQFSVGAIILFIVGDLSFFDKTFDYWLNIFLFSALFTVIPMLLNLYALKGIESSQVAFMIYINPIISFILGVTIYGELIKEIELIAFALLFIAIICFNYNLLKTLFSRA
jgi:chloramphenicol-sensitive protein RarD